MNPLDALGDGAAEGDGGVEVTARDVPEGVRAGQHGQAEGEGHADEADAHVHARLGEHLGGQDGRCEDRLWLSLT